jgi:hypothetical protein
MVGLLWLMSGLSGAYTIVYAAKMVYAAKLIRMLVGLQEAGGGGWPQKTIIARLVAIQPATIRLSQTYSATGTR